MSQTAPRFDFYIDCKVAGDIGKVRKTNEDAYLAAPELGLFAVADGMGGHAAGEVAARLAIDEVRASISSPTSQYVMDTYANNPNLDTRRHVFARLRRAIEHANTRVRDEAANNPSYAGMGATIDVAWLARDRAFIGHAGDGRAYLGRPSAMIQLTQDHAEIENLKMTGALRPYGRHARSNRLLNAVGIGDSIAVDTLFVELHRGDRLLLCTDGVHGQIPSEAQLRELLSRGDAETAARALVARAGERGRDNATAVVIAVRERFVSRGSGDRGLAAADLVHAQQCTLLRGLTKANVLATLAVAVEIEFGDGELIPRAVANDLVAYILLDGLVDCGDGRVISLGALLFAESLVGVAVDDALPHARDRVRALRVRADDFAEVCSTDVALAVELYRRLASHIARSGAGAVARTRQRTSQPDEAVAAAPDPPQTPADDRLPPAEDPPGDGT